jgi:hypothetical protein
MSRKKNPIQGGERLSMLREAAILFREFTGDEGELVARVKNVQWPKVAAVIGEMDGVLYSTVRDGQDEKYIHRFKKSARPLLCVSHDGSMLVIVLGKYRFTDRGIVDA